MELARAAILARYYSTFLLMICVSYYMKGNAIQYLYIHARSIFWCMLTICCYWVKQKAGCIYPLIYWTNIAENGVKISRSGSFRPAIDQLCLAAKRGLFKIRSNLNNYRLNQKSWLNFLTGWSNQFFFTQVPYGVALELESRMTVIL